MQEHTPQDETRPTSSAPEAQTHESRLKRMAIGLMVGTVVITGAVAYSLGQEGLGLSVAMLLIVAATLTASAALVNMFGYRTRALTPGIAREEARQASIAEHLQRTVLRFLLIEAALLVAIALAFVLGDGVTIPVMLSGAGALALMYLHVYPSEATVARTEQSLERKGAASFLREAMYGEGAQPRS